MFPNQNPGQQPTGQTPSNYPQGATPPQSQPTAPPQAGGQQHQIMQLDPAIAQHIDPNNAIQMLLMQRIDKFTAADGAAMQQLTPQQVATLKKVMPEVGFLLDMVHAGQMPQGGAMPPGGAPMPPQGGAPPPPQGGGQPPMAQPQPRPPGAGLSRF